MYKNLLSLNLLILVSLMVCQAQSTEVKDKAYPFQKGNMAFNRDNIKMNYVKNTEIRVDTLKMKNIWNKPLYIKYNPVPQHVTCKVMPDTLLPGKEGLVILSYDAKKKNDYGYSFESLTLKTNDTLEPEKYFFIMVYIEEDFSGITDKQRMEAPKIVFKNEKYDFGTINSGEKVKYSFEFSNEGKSDLIIRRTKASCGCTASEPEKTVLKPGESSKINIVFDSNGLKGEQHKTVYVYNNDPRYSTVALQIAGNAK